MQVVEAKGGHANNVDRRLGGFSLRDMLAVFINVELNDLL
jgi:hypothetical protein